MPELRSSSVRLGFLRTEQGFDIFNPAQYQNDGRSGHAQRKNALQQANSQVNDGLHDGHLYYPMRREAA